MTGDLKKNKNWHRRKDLFFGGNNSNWFPRHSPTGDLTLPGTLLSSVVRVPDLNTSIYTHKYMEWSGVRFF